MGPVFFYSVSVWCRCRARVSAFRSREFLQSCNRDHQDRTDPAWSGLEHPLGSPNPRALRWVTHSPLIGQNLTQLASDWLLLAPSDLCTELTWT